MKIDDCLTIDQIQAAANMFNADRALEGLYLWADGTLSAEPAPGETLPFFISRYTPLRYSSCGDWSGELAFRDRLMGEDLAWEFARRGVLPDKDGNATLILE